VVEVSGFDAAVSVTVPSWYTPGPGESNDAAVGVGEDVDGALVVDGVVGFVEGVPELHIVVTSTTAARVSRDGAVVRARRRRFMAP
jgi:hypothetical protein